MTHKHKVAPSHRFICRDPGGGKSYGRTALDAVTRRARAYGLEPSDQSVQQDLFAIDRLHPEIMLKPHTTIVEPKCALCTKPLGDKALVTLDDQPCHEQCASKHASHSVWASRDARMRILRFPGGGAVTGTDFLVLEMMIGESWNKYVTVADTPGGHLALWRRDSGPDEAMLLRMLLREIAAKGPVE